MLRKGGVGVGNTVFELGCGPGFFTESIAQIIGENGLVYAQDVEPKMIELLKKRMADFAVNDNIKPLLASSDNTKLADGVADVVFAANVFEEVEKENILDSTAVEMKRLLKKGAHIAVFEHKIGVSGPRFEKIINALEKAGFKPIRRKDSLLSYYIWLEKP